MHLEAEYLPVLGVCVIDATCDSGSSMTLWPRQAIRFTFFLPLSMSTPLEQAPQSSSGTQKYATFPHMTIQQEGKWPWTPACNTRTDWRRCSIFEDSIIHTRITNDEKALRRVTKKFHSYASVAYDAVVPPSPANSSSVDDARDAFLVELASFHLSLKKSLLVCEAEARQVEEYQREKERIGEWPSLFVFNP